MTLSLGVAEFELSELNLVGAEEESAKKTLTEKGFSVEEKSEYSDTVEKGKSGTFKPREGEKGRNRNHSAFARQGAGENKMTGSYV